MSQNGQNPTFKSKNKIIQKINVSSLSLLFLLVIFSHTSQVIVKIYKSQNKIFTGGLPLPRAQTYIESGHCLTAPNIMFPGVLDNIDLE